MTTQETDDASNYLSNLQNLANAQDRAKLSTLALEFGTVLAAMPTLNAEMNAFLQPSTSRQDKIDYEGLVARLEPQLEQAGKLLSDLDFLPAAVRNHPAVAEFVQTALAKTSFRTVGSAIQRLQAAVIEAKTPVVIVAPTSSSWAGATGQDQYGRYGELNLAGVKQRFRTIPSGSFLMGSPESEPERSGDEDQHRINFKQDFWLADTACTQALWHAVMGDNPSYFKETPEHPVEQVSWDDVQIFLQRANDLVPNMVLRLPSEAEWEYACRAGTNGAFSFGSSITSGQANYNGEHVYNGGKKGEYRGKTVPVKSFSTNGYGLYQMHGNVWEWCQDSYDSYSNTPTDGSACRSDESGRRVVRGGSWGFLPGSLRSAYRDYYAPGDRYVNFGFRLVCAPPFTGH
jgi:formylglycine-generating enzyme required for sulfatase activity